MKDLGVEDAEYCKVKDTHMFVKHEDGEMRCFYCNITYKEFRKDKEKEK